MKQKEILSYKERDRESVKLERKLKMTKQMNKERRVHSYEKKGDLVLQKRETENQYEINKRKKSILPNKD